MKESPLSTREREKFEAQYSEIATLAGGLAHEIKNPLSTMSLNLELLTEDLDSLDVPAKHRMLKKVESVQQECKHLQEILDAFLQFARVGKLALSKANLNDLVSDFIDFFRPQAREANIEISPHFDADLPTIQVDKSLLRQVLMNLALNVVQAMPDGGLIELQTYHKDGMVYLDMIDNGKGIDENVKARMFDAFFSTKSGGSGLGLPTVKKIIDTHQGTIECESEPGRGTRFTIAFPVC
ncbi:sensor histidine kinase [Gimesia aquarii]|uniref:histidine kinase n=1 Tax=Gimesia aquarii TaxID=2527964 RepID=A0A517WZV9_9PLAN|nr:ATP-binding protein [Gimesia aquarii]QDT97216.1 Sensor protein ZraS [Gimesia aquarii]QDU10788.1 Sensor protein ZraS [Gimesia aquarii]